MTRLRLLLWALLFGLLTAGGVALAIWRADMPLPTEDLRALGPVIGAGALLGSLGLFAADALRYRTVGRALGVDIAWPAAFEAGIANGFFAWFTPGGSMGMPAAMAALGRRGVPWHAATLTAFCKGASGTGVLLVLGFAALAAGPALDPHIVFLMTGGLAIVAALLSPVLLGSVFPARALRTCDRLEAATSRPSLVKLIDGTRSGVERLAGIKARSLPGIFASHGLYYGVFIGVAVLVAAGLGATPLMANIATSTVYLAFTYVAPTPGAAGLAEAAATDFYGELLPLEEAVLAVVLFRALTLYLQLIVGAGWLMSIGGLSELRRWQTER